MHVLIFNNNIAHCIQSAEIQSSVHYAAAQAPTNKIKAFKQTVF